MHRPFENAIGAGLNVTVVDGKSVLLQSYSMHFHLGLESAFELEKES